MMLLDTSGLFSYLLPDDSHHVLARRLMDGSRRRVIHSDVIFELVALIDARRKNRAMVLGFLRDVIDDPDYDIFWLDEEDVRQSLALLQARPDKRYSLCDAASFILMRRMNIRDALTTDHHFEQEDFVQLLK